MPRFLSWPLLAVLAACSPLDFLGNQSATVQLVLDAPQASEVYLVTSLENFQPLPAFRDAQGGWVSEGLADREFRYFYVIDGTIHVPDCRYREEDDFGATTCIYQP